MSHPGGRPTVMTEEVIRKLEDAFTVGATDREAIFYADIGKTAFYDYCQEHPEFTERIDMLRDMPKYKARKIVAKALEDGDKTIATWYLERKAKDEFSQRSELTGDKGKDLFEQKIDEADAEIINQLRARRDKVPGSSADPVRGATQTEE